MFAICPVADNVDDSECSDLVTSPVGNVSIMHLEQTDNSQHDILNAVIREYFLRINVLFKWKLVPC